MKIIKTKKQNYLQFCFYNYFTSAGGSEAHYNLVPGAGPVLLRAKDWGMFGVGWLFGLIVMNGSQIGEIGQERGYTVQNGRKLGQVGISLELLRNGWFFVYVFGV